ncbi:AAA ATPase (plasmid) [Rhizobium leguminosarum bv. trifolii WSM2304]|uniref:AAA ATPase n=1 Tax=Rhizobium leguminosarum bv. trifolii (strain WSM2304) TaxID=395492 RepID=A0ABF7QVJ3_RHILW|nr:AAA family ATPase [Rhizobium leguminosarum]ACI58175.1 AAA ATPase [Rhizobium leguminosarum bv. trifolii WSM2304]
MTASPSDTPTEQFKLFFSSHAQSIENNTILITPSGDSFDDFRFKTRVKVFVRRDSVNLRAEFSAMIGFLQSSNNEVNGADLIKNVAPDSAVVPEDNFPKFFTLLLDLDAYRDLVSDTAVAGAREILLKTCDLVALGEFLANSPILRDAPNTAVFQFSLTRTAEAFFAYKNAGPILRGLGHEEIGRMSPTIAVSFKLAAFENKHELRFNFDHAGFLPKRMAIIIGKNGVGKSQALGTIAKQAIKGGGLIDPQTGERAQFNRMLAFAPTKEALSVFPSTTRRRQYVRYSRYALARSSPTRKAGGLINAIVSVARSNQAIKGRSRWQIFQNAIDALGDIKSIWIWTNDGIIPLHALNQGGEQEKLRRFASINSRRDPVRFANGNALRLSSGEISFLKFAAYVSLEIDNSSLLLFDEPETHLHPNFIARFVSILDSLLAQTGSAAIIATHSAYFLREVFREQISILRAGDDGRIEVQRPRLATFGADIGEISYFVFGEDEPSYLAQELEKNIQSLGMKWDEILERYSSELSLEFLNEIRAKISG